MQIDRPRRFGLSIPALVLCMGLSGCEPASVAEPAEPAIFHVRYALNLREPTLPASYLRIVGGPNGQIVIHGADLQLNGNQYESTPITLADNPAWPLTVTLVTPTGDTLAQVTATLPIERKHVVNVSLHAMRNRSGWFVCSEVQRQVAIRQLEVAPAQPPDTLYLWASAQIPGVQYPVC